MSDHYISPSQFSSTYREKRKTLYLIAKRELIIKQKAYEQEGENRIKADQKFRVSVNFFFPYS